MSLLRAATALLDGLLALVGKATVWLTLRAGHVPQVRTTRAGNNFSAQDMLLQHLYAKQQLKKKQKVVQLISVVSKNTDKTQPLVLTVRSTQPDGASYLIPVFQTLLPAVPAQNRKPRAVLRDTRGRFTKAEPAHVQTPMDSLSLDNG